jgi:hypothetical protein
MFTALLISFSKSSGFSRMSFIPAFIYPAMSFFSAVAVRAIIGICLAYSQSSALIAFFASRPSARGF